MRTLRSIPVLVMTILLGACQHGSFAPDIVTRAGVPVQRSAAVAAAGATQEFVPTLLPGECNRQRCLVQIEFPAGATSCSANPTINVNPMELQLGNIGSRRIVWRFAPGSPFEFCPSRGDGVFLQAKQRGEFRYLGATDSDQGDEEEVGEGQCRRNFRVDNWNAESFTYRYFLQFSDRAGNTCKVDPWIKNGR